jgi:hypothetical protein
MAMGARNEMTDPRDGNVLYYLLNVSVGWLLIRCIVNLSIIWDSQLQPNVLDRCNNIGRDPVDSGPDESCTHRGFSVALLSAIGKRHDQQ